MYIVLENALIMRILPSFVVSVLGFQCVCVASNIDEESSCSREGRLDNTLHLAHMYPNGRRDEAAAKDLETSTRGNLSTHLVAEEEMEELLNKMKMLESEACNIGMEEKMKILENAEKILKILEKKMKKLREENIRLLNEVKRLLEKGENGNPPHEKEQRPLATL